MTPEERNRLLAELSEPLYSRELPDGRVITVDRLMFGRARINVSPDKSSQVYEDGY